MAIDVGLYIPVTNNVQNSLNNAKTFAGLVLSSNPLIPTTTPMLQFINTPAVGEYFGTTSNEYKASLKYFASFTVALNAPPYIYFGKYVAVAIAPYLRGGKILNTTTTLASLNAVTAGNLTVVVDGVSYSLTGISLSADTSLSSVAATVSSDLNTAHAPLVTAGFNITYDGVNDRFIASVTGTGSAVTMNFFSSTGVNPLADMMYFTQATNATLSQGADAQTVSQNLNYLKTLFTDQFSICFLDNLNGALTTQNKYDLMQWVNDQGDKYWSVIWDNEVALGSSTDTTSLWYLATQAELNNWSIFYEVLANNSDRVVAAMGIFASVDLTQPNSAITLAFKTQTGLIPSVTNTDLATILNAKGINYYGIVGLTGSANTLNYFYPGAIGGKWKFVDNLVAAVWITYQCQFQTISILTAVGQVPIDPDGQGQIRSGLRTAMGGSIKTLYGISPIELTNNGYAVLNTIPAAGLRELRVSSPWYVLYVKGSAYQFIPINSNTYF
jgi:hypothetical protein